MLQAKREDSLHSHEPCHLSPQAALESPWPVCAPGPGHRTLQGAGHGEGAFWNPGYTNSQV